MTNIEMIEMLKLAASIKTLYVKGCFGAPLNNSNKERYSKNNSYNKKPARAKMINEASNDTFGFDCICLVKGILWGWNGDENARYGGASYEANNVPDSSIESMFKKHCHDQSDDFTSIEPGEFLIIGDSHCGVYIGEGMAIECTPKWDNCVQVTEVWNVCKTSSKGRMWDAHAKINVLDYVNNQENLGECIVILDHFPNEGEADFIKSKLGGLGYKVRIAVEGG